MKLSIRKFLLFNLLLAIMVIVTITAIGNYYLSQKDIQNNFDNLLSQAAYTIQTLSGDDIKSRNLSKLQIELNAIPLERVHTTYKNSPAIQPSHYTEPYQFQIWDLKSNHLILRSPYAPNFDLGAAKTGFSNKFVNNELWRIFTVIDKNTNLTYVVGEHYDVRAKLAQRITLDEIIIILLTFPLSSLLIWIIIGKGLSSISRVATEVSQRAADHLEPVDLEGVPTEIKPLVDELNKLFLRLKQAFDREQRFAADAAHELRTPLAALKTLVQVALKTTDAHERQTQLYKVITGVDRCTHVVQQLLTLYRVAPESSSLEDPTEVDLLKISSEVIGQLAPIAVEKEVDIELVASKSKYVLLGNTTGLYALIRNLVDNAIRYTPPNGFIKVFLDETRTEIIVRVIDNGPGIPPELRARVFERFYRILGTNTQGSGLGLAIVQQIVRSHKGEVTLSVPESGQGLEVEVRLPKNKKKL